MASFKPRPVGEARGTIAGQPNPCSRAIPCLPRSAGVAPVNAGRLPPCEDFK